MSIERVNYFDRQYLHLEDFTDEQRYHIAMRRRHNISHHTWGIVEGLEPTIVDGSPHVSPGLAIDGFGRELILEMLQPLPPQAFVDFDTNELQVWIDYATTLTNPPSGGPDGEQQYSRRSEKPNVRFAKPDVNSTPRMPSSVFTTDRNFDATQTPPEDRNWPVFLGTVKFNAANIKQPYSIDLSQRPYAGLVGESVLAPSGSTRLQIGAEQTSDPNRFAVFIPASATDPRLAIHQDGTVNIRGETTMRGNVTVTGAIDVGVGPATSPQPWRIYRVQQTDANGMAANEMRIEMNGGGAGKNQVVIGAWSTQDSKFKPCLTVQDDGTVTVAGNLVIVGKLDVNPDNMVPGTLSTEAKAFVASAAMTGFATGRGQVNPAVLMQTPGLAPVALVAAPTAGSQFKEVASLIANPDEKHLKDFAGMLKSDYKEIAARLKRFLD